MKRDRLRVWAETHLERAWLETISSAGGRGLWSLVEMGEGEAIGGEAEGGHHARCRVAQSFVATGLQLRWQRTRTGANDRDIDDLGRHEGRSGVVRCSGSHGGDRGAGMD